MPTPQEMEATIRFLRRELKHAAKVAREVSATLDHSNIGRSKFRLIRLSDRAALHAANGNGNGH